jgi:hypothetical protein
VPGVGPNASRKLAGEPALGDAIVVVNVAARDAGSPAVHEILGQLGLGFDVAQPPAGPVDGDAVVFRVPHERLAEVVVGLESYGFVDVRAYEGRDAHPMA